MQENSLTIPVYLNQQIVFDLLAMKEDGFSMLRTVKTTVSEESSNNKNFEGGIGISNVFALLSTQFKAAKGESKSDKGENQTEEERIHTPNSLFSKLKLILGEENSIHNIDEPEKFSKIQVGQFVEFDATLSKPPLVSIMEGMLEFTKLESFFATENTQTAKSNNSKNTKSSTTKSSSSRNTKQIEDFLSGITPKKAIQLIGKLTRNPKIRTVLFAKPDFFLDNDVTEVLEGEFRILGKVLRIVSDSNESISLLNRTTFSLIQTRMFEQVIASFGSGQDVGLNMPELEVEVKAPAFQIIPIAIFR